MEPYLVTLLPEAGPYAAFQHPGLKLIHMVSGRVRYRYGQKTMEVTAGDTMLFESSGLHGVAAIKEAPVSYLSLVLTLRRQALRARSESAQPSLVAAYWIAAAPLKHSRWLLQPRVGRAEAPCRSSTSSGRQRRDDPQRRIELRAK